jgi:thymidylate synthase (FAD)
MENYIKVELLDYMGGDLQIVNDARVSYNKKSTKFNEKDRKLLEYLIKNKHYSPLRGCIFKFRIKAPLFIARQFWKHVVASTHTEEQLQWNEQSFRYSKLEELDYYLPKSWQQQSKNNKQKGDTDLTEINPSIITDFIKVHEECYRIYKNMLEAGISKEQARAVLPSGICTNWVWTSSLQAILNFLQLRLEESAQKEIQDIASEIKNLITPKIPSCMEIWENVRNY